MATNLEKVCEWIENDFKFASVKNNVIITDTEDENWSRIHIFTDNNQYTIGIKEEDETDFGYLGAGATSRKPRPGEDWTRGSDLHDGKFCKETWNRILADIISYEMVKVFNKE